MPEVVKTKHFWVRFHYPDASTSAYAWGGVIPKSGDRMWLGSIPYNVVLVEASTDAGPQGMNVIDVYVDDRVEQNPAEDWKSFRAFALASMIAGGVSLALAGIAIAWLVVCVWVRIFN